MNTGLLLFAFCGLMGLCAAAMWLLRAQEHETKIRRRLAAVAPTAQSLRPIGTPTGALALAARPKDGPVERVTGLLGFDLAKQDQYPVRWPVALAGCAVAGYVASLLLRHLLGGLGWLGLPAAFVLSSRFFFGWCRNRRKNRMFIQFPDALAMIVRSVRVGIPVSEAIRAVAREQPLPTGPEFARLADEVGIGVPLDQALHVMAARNDLSEYKFFATALSLQNQTGGALSETLENLADVIRKRVAMRERGKALASEAKTSAGILAVLPILSGLGLYALNPEYMTVLFVDPTGQFVLAGAVVMLFGGIMTMRTIIQKSLQ